MIPVYSLDGGVERRRITSRAALAQEAQQLLTLVRNRKGAITRAFRTKADKSTNLLKTAYMGTAYSYLEKLPSGHQCADLTRLGGGRHGKNYAPASLRPIFLKVVTDCMAAANA